MAEAAKPHLSVVICGHVDSGKSTTSGRLIFDLGGVPEREMEKLKKEAADRGKSSFAFAFYMDTQKEERDRGVTIVSTTKEFYTDRWHYTIIDAPGHRDFIKNMISGAAQADVGVLMVPADGNFTTAIAKGDHKAGIIQGQTRQHSRLLNLLGVKQLIIGVNKMDADIAGPYGQARFDEIAAEMRDMLGKTGWKKEFIDASVPVIPISGWKGDNLLKKSDEMPWYSGKEYTKVDGSKTMITTLLDALNNFAELPTRKNDAPMRTPISGIYSIPGVGSVLAGRVEQGIVQANNRNVIFLPTHTIATPCAGQVFSIEMHHKKVEQGQTGDNIGMNIKKLEKSNMPRTGDVMIYKEDTSISHCVSFTAQVATLDVPGELKVGYTPIGFVRCSRSACKITALNWKVGKETGKKKADNPHALKANEQAEIVCQPIQPIIVDSFKNCEGLSRIAFLDGNSAIMLGKIVAVENVNK